MQSEKSESSSVQIILAAGMPEKDWATAERLRPLSLREIIVHSYPHDLKQHAELFQTLAFSKWQVFVDVGW